MDFGIANGIKNKWDEWRGTIKMIQFPENFMAMDGERCGR